MTESQGYVDLHLHLLPNVDDGPRSMEDAVDMARVLVDDGVAAATVTPHFNEWNPDLLPNVDALTEQIDSLRQSLDSEQVPLQLLTGAEHFLTPELLHKLKLGEAPTLAGGPYILVELPFGDKPIYADELLHQLGLSEVMPVLAHPERYRWVQQDPDSIRPLRERGVLLQLTAASMLGHYGPGIRKTAERLLLHGDYHLVGSDRHRARQSRSLSELEAAVAPLIGSDATDVLFRQNPRRVLRGEPLLPVLEEPIQPPKKTLLSFLGRS